MTDTAGPGPARCPYCGAVRRGTEPWCWLCQADVRDVTSPARLATPAAPPPPAPLVPPAAPLVPPAAPPPTPGPRPATDRVVAPPPSPLSRVDLPPPGSSTPPPGSTTPTAHGGSAGDVDAMLAALRDQEADPVRSMAGRVPTPGRRWLLALILTLAAVVVLLVVASVLALVVG